MNSPDEFGRPELRKLAVELTRPYLEARGIDLSKMTDAELEKLLYNYATALFEQGKSPKEVADIVITGLEQGLKTTQ